MKRKTGSLAWLLACGWLIAAPVTANSGVLTLQADNDGMVSEDDSQYTAGMELVWAQALSPQHWTRRIVDQLPPGWLGSVNTVGYHLSYRMYTPDDVERRDLIENDRPYAGLVLGGLSLHGLERQGSWQREDTLQFDIGVVGPMTGADSVQREVHRFTNSDRPRGWSHQLRNEPVINASYRRHWWHRQALGPLELQHGPGLSAALGNLVVQAGAGYGVRLGQGIDNTMTTPSIGVEQVGYRQAATPQESGWHLFAALQGRFVAHHLLLDGNTWKESHSVDRREWVGDAVFGLALTWEKWQVSLAHIWRSKEFDEQEQSTTHGALTLSYRF